MQHNFHNTQSIMGLRVLAVWLLVLASASASALPEPERILVLQSFRNAMPVNSDFFAGIREGLELPIDVPVEIDSEDLDLSRINDEKYVRKLVEIYALKYRTSPPNLIIATHTSAVRLLLLHRNNLFPGVPIVFCAAELSPQEIAQLPPDVTGVTSKGDFAGTLQLMSRLHPDLRQIAVILGGSDLDKARELDVSTALRPFQNRFEIIWLRGLPLSELVETTRTLPPHTATLYVVQFGDRNGVSYVPRKVVQAVAEHASGPVYGLWDTLMGTGIVGGRLISIEQQGVMAGKIARRILLGEDPASIPVVRMEQNQAVVDARQLQRWNIDEQLLPTGSRILNRDPSIWEQYRSAILIVIGLIAFQALWIAALLRNRQRLQRTQISLNEQHDRRVRAEELARRLRARIGVADKQNTLGALAGRIAHEINQPLIAIQNYAQAAQRYISTDSTKAGKLAELLAEMEGEADRAGTIIRKIRELRTTGQIDAVPVDLDLVLKEVLAVMKPEADACGCHIDYRVTASAPVVLADALHIQLVVVNLLRNAMEATASDPQGKEGSVVLTLGATLDRGVQVSVADSGPGVPAEEVEDIFESLYSTKTTGMGIGLATCRTIIEAHGGRIECSANPAGGAIFQFVLPMAETGE